MERVSLDPNALVPPEYQCQRTGHCVHDREIAEVLIAEKQSPFRLTDDAINFIIKMIDSEQPRSVIEFGSGISTVWLCKLLARIHGKNGFRLLSIEQDESEMRRTEKRLHQCGIWSSCRMVHCPLVSGRAGGRQTAFYDLGKVPEQYFHWLGKAELIIIDGPFAQGPCRYGTLPRIQQYIKPGASFIMDDALREKELFAGYLWTEEGFNVHGVYAIGEGVMVGRSPM